MLFLMLHDQGETLKMVFVTQYSYQDAVNITNDVRYSLQHRVHKFLKNGQSQCNTEWQVSETIEAMMGVYHYILQRMLIKL